MNRNQKIGLGCGVAGCLGLIVVIAAAAVLYFYLQRQPTSRNRNSNANISTNRASNNNSATDSSDETPSSSSLSDDDKHKLFQAAGTTQDNELILRVLKKIGFSSGTGPAYEEFVKDHFAWAINNVEFISSVDTPDKARAYVESHLDD